MPPIIGTQPIANFVVTSLPSGATFLLGAIGGRSSDPVRNAG
jgi:hypothetical protein